MLTVATVYLLLDGIKYINTSHLGLIIDLGFRRKIVMNELENTEKCLLLYLMCKKKVLFLDI